MPERGSPGRKRIDIAVDIPTDDGPFCLAFENKPYADDQPGQCRDYLEFLDGEYRGRFLLVYLPPRYRMPDESSLKITDYYVNGLLTIAAKAIPAIDDVELEERSPAASEDS